MYLLNFEQSEFIASPKINTQLQDIKKVKVQHSVHIRVTISKSTRAVEHFCMKQKGEYGKKDFSLMPSVLRVVITMCI